MTSAASFAPQVETYDRRMSLPHLAAGEPVGEMLHASFSVDCSYSVCFTSDALHPGNPTLAEAIAARRGASVLAVLDSGMVACNRDLPQRLLAYAQRHAGAMRLAGEPIVLPGGERVKQDARHVERVLDAIEARGVDRHSYVLAIGGGALLDVVGYAAAIAHRGVRLIRMPSTVLAQNDSGIGVKNGLNAYGKKNFLGTFAPPAAVIADQRLLTTLSDRDWRAGASEAIKVAALKDAAFFGALEDLAPAIVERNLAAMNVLVRRCAELHLAHIVDGGDPFELGSARPLDFGHWSAHKLEHLSALRLRHGEAVSIGIALDSTYSWLAGMLAREHRERVLALIEAFGLPLFVPELEDPRLLAGLREFQEHLGGELTITLLRRIGAGVEVHEVDRSLMRSAVRELRERALAAGCPPRRSAIGRSEVAV
jgi:3-dehydroquinate synthase